jgi:hypothetical protein
MATSRNPRIRKLAEGGYAVMSSPWVGLDLRADPKQARPGSLLLSQNFVPYSSQVFSKRKGTLHVNASPWADVLSVPWATRFYLGSGAKKTVVAVTKAAGDVLGQVDDTTGAFTALTGMPAVGASQRWSGTVAGEVPTLYMADNYSTNGILYTTDGVAVAQLAGTGIPAKGFMAEPYFDRLLCYTGKRVYYSRTNLYTNWTNPDSGNSQYLLVMGDEDIEAVFMPGPMDTEVGYGGRLYVCTPTSTWVHLRDFDGSDGSPNSAFTKIHERAGIAGFKTIAWTDQGCVGMGTNNIWWFPITGLPQPIGYEVESIIEAIPSAYRSLCSAIFWKGFYILSYVRPGMTYPDRELWCDMRTFQPAYAAYRSGLDTPAAAQGIVWHGPMVREGIGIGSFVLRSQVPDEGELYAYGAAEGRAMQLETDIYTDGGEPIVSILTTADLGTDLPAKVYEGFVYAAYTHGDDAVTVSYSADEGSHAGAQSLTFAPNYSLWDIADWDSGTWASDLTYFMAADHWDDRPTGDKIKITLTHSTVKQFDLKELGAWMHVLGRMAA